MARTSKTKKETSTIVVDEITTSHKTANNEQLMNDNQSTTDVVKAPVVDDKNVVTQADTIQSIETIKQQQQKILTQEQTIQQLQASLAQMNALMATLNATNQSSQKSAFDQEVTIICNVHGAIQVKFPTWTLNMSKFGQKLIVTRLQFQELVNSHRKYFDREYILLDSQHLDLAEQLDVPVYDPNSSKFIKPADLSRIGEMDVRTLEKYYIALSQPMQRIFLSWYMRKCYDKEPGFFNVEKMSMLDNVSHTNVFEMLIKTCLSDNQQNNNQ